MTPTEPNLSESMSFDALRVWLDFWELTGARRVDLVRRTESGGDPERMIPPDITEHTISAIPAILVEDEAGSTLDRSGDLDLRSVKMELIDAVREGDRIRYSGMEYKVEHVETRDMGSFTVWIAEGHRVE
jgi:hypothetical protein